MLNPSNQSTPTTDQCEPKMSELIRLYSPAIQTRTSFIALLLSVLLVASASADHFRVFVLGGQSNMGGSPLVDDLPAPFDQPNEDVLIWQDDGNSNVGWTDLRGGFSGSGAIGDGDKWGPEISLGPTLHDSFGSDRVAFVKHVEAGTGATMQLGWNPDLGGGQGSGHIYTDFIEKTETAISFLSGDGHTFEISGVFFAQGIRDTTPSEGTAAAEYEENFLGFIGALRTEFATPDLPVVFAQINDAGINSSNDVRRQNWNHVRNAQASVAELDPWASMVTTDDLPKLDNLHYDAAGQIEFGQRLGNAYFDLAALREPHLFAEPGDANLDGSVDFSDFLLLSTNFGLTGGWRDGDFDDDGFIQFSDFLILSTNFGQSKNEVPAPSQSVPEPSGIVVALVGVVFLARRNCRLK